MEGAPLPPGETGLPLLGETLTLLKNGFAFVEAGARKHGPIFKTNVFFRPTAVTTGPNAGCGRNGVFLQVFLIELYRA
jgi:hypothetical protein